VERQELIERLLVDEGRVSVIQLARRFDVTTETVRRDLNELERAGALHRVHGGAVTRERDSTAEPTVAERSHRRSDAKIAIARRALQVIGDRFRGSLYFDAGTTTHAVASQLSDRLIVTEGRAEIVTHAMTLAHTLAGGADADLTVIGGRVRTATAAAVGADTVRAIERLRPDIAILGTNGISASFGLSTPDPDEAAVKTAIVRAARRVVVVADADKLERELLVSFAPLEAIDVLVTDAAPDKELATALSEAGVEVWLA
jgi:DeoR family fructose operon transcriptional repressor